MKKLFAALLSALLMFTASACVVEDDGEGEDGTTVIEGEDGGGEEGGDAEGGDAEVEVEAGASE